MQQLVGDKPDSADSYMFEFLAWVQVFGLDLSLSVVYDRSGSNSGKIGMDWLVHVHTW